MDEFAGEAMRIRNDLKSKMRKQVQEKTETIRDHTSDKMKLAMDQAKLKGASS